MGSVLGAQWVAKRRPGSAGIETTSCRAAPKGVALRRARIQASGRSVFQTRAAGAVSSVKLRLSRPTDETSRQQLEHTAALVWPTKRSLGSDHPARARARLELGDLCWPPLFWWLRL
jgi:hypothetical protein